MKRIMVVAPHPDDETIGCAGTLLNAANEGAEIHWVIVTEMPDANQFNESAKIRRNAEINQVARLYNMTSVHRLGFSALALSSSSIPSLVESLGKVVNVVEPTDLFLPFRRDAHSDHKFVFDAGTAVSKWFRYKSLERVFCYETMSETDFDLNPDSCGFRPNLFVDISEYLDKKVEIAAVYGSEFQEHPFPRSLAGIKALS